MAAISPDNFDPLRRYVDVRLQMGVPLIDRDWNELADMRRFDLRSVLKWFVGNGIPGGSNAFLIQSTNAVDDFVLRAGASTPPVGVLAGLPDQRSKNIAIALGAGRCVVDGLEVLIEADIPFTKQPLHKSQPGAAALAAGLGVPVVDMPAPVAGTVAAYLDVWEHAVVPTADPDNIILPGLGVESCARIKREWVVRVRTGNTVPQPTNPDYLAGHGYYLLAVITRVAADGTVKPEQIADKRQTKVTLNDLERRMSVLEQLLLVPAFAASPNQFTPKLGLPATPGVLATSVTLLGSNFNVGTPVVRFGATIAQIVGTPSSNQIVVRVPSMAAGTVKITVETGGGSDVSDDPFTVLPLPAPTFNPAPNQFTPKLGPANTAVTLLGSNFNIGTTTVLFGTTAAVVGTVTATQIAVTVPTMPAGAVKITIQTSGGGAVGGGGSATSDDTFTVT